MIHEKESILDDLAPFVDLGTEPPALVEDKGRFVTRFLRDSYLIELVFSSDGSVVERFKDEERRHVGFKALLASRSFANLGKWADSQALQIRTKVSEETLPIRGLLAGENGGGDLSFFDDMLAGKDDRSLPRVTVTLVNGPAGIGKTSLIRTLAHRRSSLYRRIQRPLILHVESRGRMLQNITDLMAFSLQSLRLGVTYDQIPSLVRNGLVTLAIDGFDELGDPSGYDLAWAQVNDLITAARGQGNIILAGRETFISKDRMEIALTSVDKSVDKLQIYTLSPLVPSDARKWLISSGWSESLLNSEFVTPLFEEGSYALRPFFLTQLARHGVASQIEEGGIEDLLSFLITAMIEREAGKFGRDIEAATTSLQRKEFIEYLMEEVARDLAENQTDAIPSETLAWLAEIVASDIVQPNLVGVLKNRAGVIAFLGDDDRRGYRRFVHEQVSNYFLSQVTVRSVALGETPKYVRRNILGLEFLENFCSVFRYKSHESAKMFFDSCTRQMNSLGEEDRARRNIAALMFAGCSVSEPETPPVIKDVSLDDVYLTESVSSVCLKDVTIAQLYAREADLRAVRFEGSCFIASLIADSGTIPSETLPIPSLISLPDKTLVDPHAKQLWLDKQLKGLRAAELGSDLKTALTEDFELFSLLARIARYKPFWLKSGDEKAARRILDDPNWDLLKRVMLEYDLLVERHDVQASGRPGPFYHVKNRQRLLLLDHPPAALIPFLLALLTENLRIRALEDEM